MRRAGGGSVPRPQAGSGGGEALGLSALTPQRREALPRGGGAAGWLLPPLRSPSLSARARRSRGRACGAPPFGGGGRGPSDSARRSGGAGAGPQPLWAPSGLGGAPERGAPRGGQAWGSLTRRLPACCPAGRRAAPVSSPRSGLCTAARLRVGARPSLLSRPHRCDGRGCAVASVGPRPGLVTYSSSLLTCLLPPSV